MSLKHAFVTPKAQDDLAKAKDYFEEQQQGLGTRFVAEFTAVVAPLLVFPNLYPKLRGEMRRGVIRRFRYIFIYTVESNAIIILRVIHGRSHNQYH